MPFILRRRWQPVASFAAVWAIALGALTALNGSRDQRLPMTGRHQETMQRPDNAAILPDLVGGHAAAYS